MVEANATDVGDLARAEGGVLGLEVADGRANVGGEAPVLLGLRRREEAGYPLGVEARRPAVEGALGGRAAEEDNRPQQLVGALLGERGQ